MKDTTSTFVFIWQVVFCCRLPIRAKFCLCSCLVNAICGQSCQNSDWNQLFCLSRFATSFLMQPLGWFLFSCDTMHLCIPIMLPCLRNTTQLCVYQFDTSIQPNASCNITALYEFTVQMFAYLNYISIDLKGYHNGYLSMMEYMSLYRTLEPSQTHL